MNLLLRDVLTTSLFMGPLQDLYLEKKRPFGIVYYSFIRHYYTKQLVHDGNDCMPVPKNVVHMNTR